MAAGDSRGVGLGDPPYLGPSRWPWVAAGVLLIVAGVLQARATELYWQPCRGQGTETYSDLCLIRMDTWVQVPYMADPPNRIPGVAELESYASLLAALAWVVIVAAVAMPGRMRWLAAATALPPLTLAAWSVISAATRWIDPERPVSRLGWVVGELLALAFLVAAVRHDRLAPQGRRWLAVVLFGATAYGLLHGFGEYSLAITVSDADWDVPPGTGLGTAFTLVACGVVTLVGRGVIRRPGRPQRQVWPDLALTS